jgi:hypothetical protein
MKMRSDDFDLGAELRALRPSPSTAFADELDARAAAGFAKDGRGGGPLGAIVRAIREISPRQLVLPAGAAMLIAVVVATTLIATDLPGQDAPSQTLTSRGGSGGQFLSGLSRSAGKPSPGVSRSAEAASGSSSGTNAGVGGGGVNRLQNANAGFALEPTSRHIERGTKLVLRSQPEKVRRNAKQVFAVIHTAHGIVLSSTIEDRNPEGDGISGAHASFELLVPNARLGDTLASLSQIADVRSRHESTLDITAPTVGAAERLGDMRARIDGLLAQLASAESDGERAALEAELRNARRIAAVLQSRLERLDQRAHFANVSLWIESGDAADDSDSGTWGVDDALDDAGRILTIAGGVLVVGLAVLGPLVLIGLLAWLAQRTCRRRRRERVLG